MFANFPRRTRLTRLAALGLGAFIATTTSAQAQVQFAKECSLRDVKVITLIEAHGETGDVKAERLADAYMTMLDARAACYEGRVGEALAIYDSILALGPAPIVNVRRQ